MESSNLKKMIFSLSITQFQSSPMMIPGFFSINRSNTL